MKNRIEKSKPETNGKAKSEREIRTEYTLSLLVERVDEDDCADGESVASVTISVDLFTDILSRANMLKIAPGKFLEEIVTDGVKSGSATNLRLEVAA